MMEKLKLDRQESPVWTNILYFLKWSLIAAVLGTVGGFFGSLFSLGITRATGLRQGNPWLLFAMPAAGLVIVWLYSVTHQEKNRGTDMVIDSISSNEKITGVTGPLIFISTVLTHLVGGSSGREGAALQLGGSIGSVLGRLLKLDEKDLKIATMCGMSAVFSALFGTPIAAGVFSLEVVSIGVLYYAAMVPCLFSAYIGQAVAGAFGIPPENYPIAQVPPISFGSVGFTVLLGALCALVSMLFCIILHRAGYLYRKFFKNPYIRVLAGSALFIALTMAVGTGDYLGSGIQLIEGAVEGQVRYEAFLLKMIFTAIALGAGFKGGEIVPTLCVGATFGCTVGSLLGFSPSLCAACGMAALFVGVTNCPITSLIIALELFGYAGMEYYSIVIAVSFALSGYYGLYASQKFVYSKTKTEFINRRPNP